MTRLHADVPVSPGCFCAYVFFLLLVFPQSSALRVRSLSRLSRARASAQGGLPALRRLPALRGPCPCWTSCPSLALLLSALRGLAALRGLPCAGVRPSMGSLSFAAFLPFAGSLPLADFLHWCPLRAFGPSRGFYSLSSVCCLFSNSLVSFERFAPCLQSLSSLSSVLLLVLNSSTR